MAASPQSSSVAPAPPPGFIPETQASATPAPPPGFVPEEQVSKQSAQPGVDALSKATSIGPQPKGALPWLQNAEGDIRQGSTNTAVGKFLHVLGAQGVNQGSQAKAGDFMASPILGATQMAQGAAQIPSQPWQGTKQFARGALNAAQIPAAMMGGEGLESGAEGADAAIKAIPSTASAGRKFEEVMGAAKNSAVPFTNELSGALSKYQQLVDAGGSRSLAASKLLNRVTDPGKGPLTYEEARMFASNISRLSADEFQRLTPVMKQAVGSLRVALNGAVQSTASAAGKGAQYGEAMSEYARASKLKQLGSDIGSYGWEQLKEKLPWLVMAGGAKKVYDAVK